MKRHIAILDFGSQYMHLISRRIRQLGVYARIYPTDVNARELKNAWGVIISGGPQSVVEQKLPYDPGIFDLPVPILGLCYGHQLLAHHLGGQVTPAHNREYGLAMLNVQKRDGLFRGLHKNEQVWMSHGDSVTRAPDEFIVIGKTKDCPVASMANAKTQRYGLQFHPEVHHTTRGLRILENFVFKICGAQPNWSMDKYWRELEKNVRAVVGQKKVFLLVSGGVDSTVAFGLLEKILGKKRVYGLHIDNGFMRRRESALVRQSLARAGFSNLHWVDASAQFLQALKGVMDPEKKRRIIGRKFIEIQRQEFAQLGFNDAEWLLGQGTIYPDTIESGGTAAADVIKTHHNRVDEILEMINQGKVVEPLAELYKDEVRELGKKLKLPNKLLQQWPFPGPGLAIRCLCANGRQQKIKNAVVVNKSLRQYLKTAGLDGRVLPIKSVGVQGDQRSYQHPVVIMDKNLFQNDKSYLARRVLWGKLAEVSVKITNSIVGVNRVVVMVGKKVDFAKMRLVKGYCTAARLNLLRAADQIVQEVVDKHGLHHEIWQFPVILLPLTFGQGETIVLRPIESQEAMTVNFYPMKKSVLNEIAARLHKISGIDAVFYDITNKPPATIEWE